MVKTAIEVKNRPFLTIYLAYNAEVLRQTHVLFSPRLMTHQSWHLVCSWRRSTRPPATCVSRGHRAAQGSGTAGLTEPCVARRCDPAYMSRKIRKFRIDEFDSVANGNFDSCNSWKLLGTSRFHVLHESKFPFVTLSNLSVRNFSFSAHVSGSASSRGHDSRESAENTCFYVSVWICLSRGGTATRTGGSSVGDGHPTKLSEMGESWHVSQCTRNPGQLLPIKFV